MEKKMFREVKDFWTRFRFLRKLKEVRIFMTFMLTNFCRAVKSSSKFGMEVTPIHIRGLHVIGGKMADFFFYTFNAAFPLYFQYSSKNVI